MKSQFFARLFTLTAALLVGLNLTAQAPSNWTAPNPAAYSQRMNTIAVISYNGVLTKDENDRVAYFVNGEFRNSTTVSQLPAAAFPQEVAHFSTIFGNGNQGDPVTVEVYHAATNSVYSAGTFAYDFTAPRGTLPSPDTLFIVSGTYLPVVLTEFTGWRDANASTVLQWKIAVEQAFSHYELERQMASSAFEVIHRQSGGQLSYTYVDKNLPPAAAGLYRLRMEDLDGSFAYSSIISVGKIDDRYSAEGHVYPNPVGRGAAIQLAELVNTYDKHVALYSATSGRFTTTIDNGRLVLPATLPSGMYYVQYGDGTRVYQTRLVVN